MSERIEPEKLKAILAAHQLWLDGDPKGEQANLRSANLRSANLQWADLQSADLRWADLRSADLRSANLQWADLRSANLRSANLRWADLRSANLQSICTATLGRYSVTVTPTETFIGCERHDNLFWQTLPFDDAGKLDTGAREWWMQWRDTVLSMIRSCEKEGWPEAKSEPAEVAS